MPRWRLGLLRPQQNYWKICLLWPVIIFFRIWKPGDKKVSIYECCTRGVASCIPEPAKFSVLGWESSGNSMVLDSSLEMVHQSSPQHLQPLWNSLPSGAQWKKCIYASSHLYIRSGIPAYCQLSRLQIPEAFCAHKWHNLSYMQIIAPIDSPQPYCHLVIKGSGFIYIFIYLNSHFFKAFCLKNDPRVPFTQVKLPNRSLAPIIPTYWDDKYV